MTKDKIRQTVESYLSEFFDDFIVVGGVAGEESKIVCMASVKCKKGWKKVTLGTVHLIQSVDANHIE